MDFQHAIPLANSYPKLARPVNYHVNGVHDLVLSVIYDSDVGELREVIRQKKIRS